MPIAGFSRLFSYAAWQLRFRVWKDRLAGLDFLTGNEPEELGLDPTLAKGSWPSGNSYLRNLLRDLSISEQDTIIDVGCGRGSAMRVMLDFPFSRVDGIEISERIASIATRNFETLGIPGNRCMVYNCDASCFTHLDVYNHVYFYNPFAAEIMKKFVENLKESVRRAPRKVRIIYNNPVCHSEVASGGTFFRIGDFPDEWGNGIVVYSNC